MNVLGDPHEFVDRVLDGWRDIAPLGEQNETAMRADEVTTKGEGIVSSPGVRSHPATSRSLDQWIETPTTMPDIKALLHSGLDFLHSNLPNRKAQPYNSCGYNLKELYLNSGADRVARQARLDREEALYRLALEAATTGPTGLRTVVLHDPSAMFYVPKVRVLGGRVFRDARVSDDDLRWMPGGGEIVGNPTLTEYPVPYGWSARRVARFMFQSALPRTCQFSDVLVDDSYQCRAEWGQADIALIVTCKARTHVAPICFGCWGKLMDETQPGALDFTFADGSDHAAGYPSDRNR
ncbi:hypothetical protein CH249_15425 [Rhodococcus sp. 05-2255-3B1]|uniref:hypothetical protein n=1 Tax=unclassified Rhodococcus (in: high G+C Gram-positive bacteria) TaxID=192944 RepID=UPI000B9AABAB|nr:MULTISPECIES: hypothetical protein [unclassified Rhodococcus (in: high G+C Gram-positive bacteria)]OZE03180.1 hypothetical protein CH250_23490 [Rhodococcus sp. 05-2255-3C]OZE09569.1 hypothetical protein CH249_15425 [Rhodococcus sp. 05-2255-3B1]OZE14835.1 hypothetical protein CH255_21770 [Rhodococcus sp. 05-2255-2A2]